MHVAHVFSTEGQEMAGTGGKWWKWEENDGNGRKGILDKSINLQLANGFPFFRNGQEMAGTQERGWRQGVFKLSVHPFVDWDYKEGCM